MSRERLATDLDALVGQLSDLRAEAAKAEELAFELENNLSEAQGRHALAVRAVADHEAMIAAKQKELREAEREEALRDRDEAAERLAATIDQVLGALGEYDAAVTEVSAKYGGREPQPEGDPIGEAWNRLKEVVRERSDVQFADERIQAAIESRMPDVVDALPADLREVARQRMAAMHRMRQGRT
jgi:DNA repair exonuclease SbcCD ATPase subunit